MTWLACLVLAAAATPRVANAQQAVPGEAAPGQEEDAALETPQATASQAIPAQAIPAQATSSDAADARQLLVRAVGEYNAGRYEEAYALFLRAHQLQPTARTLRSMGMVLFELRRYVDAAHRLSQALAETRRPLTNAQRAQTRALLARAREFVARIVVHVSPDDALLTLDGVPIELTDGELDVDAGSYTLVAQCEGCQPETAHIRVLAGESREITLSVTRQSDARGASSVASPVVRQRPNLLAPALTTALGVAFVLSAVPTGLLARQADDKLRQQCSRNICDGALRGTRDRANRFALVTDLLWGTGTALGVTGLAWLIARKARGRRPQVNVACGPEGCISTFNGRF